MNKEGLIKFEEEIKELWEKGKIKAPVHLATSKKGNLEKELIKIFRKYKKGDWIFATHRNHLLWLLSGRNPNKLKKQILEGHSMHIYDDKFFTSSIVGGIAPIALGVAWALKLKKSKNKVFCAIGDMASKTGIVKESIEYAEKNNVPILFIIMDNLFSVRAKTEKVWGECKRKNKVKKITYERIFPHSGSGKYVMW